MAELFDVIGTDIQTQLRRVMSVGLTHPNAEAFVAMAIARRGCDAEFFSVVPTGSVEHASCVDEGLQEFAQRMDRDFEKQAIAAAEGPGDE